MTVPMAIELAELRSPLEKSYRNTVYCAGLLTQGEDGRVRGLFCSNRWCLICNRIRTAKAITRYRLVLDAWEERRFVTLTIPNVAGSELREVLASFVKDTKAIARSIRHTDGLPFLALRKIECTHNPQRHDFHPHMHFVVAGAAQAKRLVERWLERHPEADAKAQDISLADSATVLELFKYFTKLATKVSDGRRVPIAPEALDTIFGATAGMRVYQPMGFRCTNVTCSDEEGEVAERAGTLAPSRLGDSVQWEWSQSLADWIDYSTGDFLTGFRPTEPMKVLVEAIRPP